MHETLERMNKNHVNFLRGPFWLIDSHNFFHAYINDNYCIPHPRVWEDDLTIVLLSVQACYKIIRLPYSLKFSRLKIFMDFMDQRTAVKIFSCKIQFHNRYEAWLEANPRKFYLQKFDFDFEQNLVKPRNIKYLLLKNCL